MGRRGVHRVTANSEAGRRMASAKGTHDLEGRERKPTPFDEHNAAIAAKREADLAARTLRRKKP